MPRSPFPIRTKLISESEAMIDRLFNDKLTRSDYAAIRSMIELDETVSLALDALIVMIVGMIGEYQNDDEKIKDEINDNLNSYNKVNENIWLEGCSFMPFGFSFAELVYTVENKLARLSEIAYLEPESVTFEGTKRKIKNVIYQGDKEYIIPYASGFHLVNQQYIAPGSRSPYGFAMGRRVLKHWDAYRIFYASYVTVGQKQATKLLVGKTDTSGEVEVGIDVDGNPITKENGDVMLAALSGTQDSSVLVVDTDDEVEAVDQTSDGKFFLEGFHFLDTNRFRGFLQPITQYGTSQSGVGDSGLAATQHKNMLMVIHGKAQYIASAFVKQVLEPMIRYNHGDQPNYGRFQVRGEEIKTTEYAELYMKFTQLLAQLITVENLSVDVAGDIKLMIEQIKTMLQLK